ncbi:nitroreductase family deazaflavin-dependent oxidoreductase [Mycobacterium rhizamassiliense]|uniref:nitroreductase family deazaflavin-dependent oxidoreductase n=1 Tax=Mycobacterium rhizamassiliense TaxID=1841860 RepID=UPI00097D36B5|nr:nitroreductase family deazaflavin-dependent oxidoreductase [Mycobacterium rhizamassiliense]
MRIVKNIRPPAGLARNALRLPIHIYRLKLGWLFGSRLLLLNHTGSVSGRPRQTILEIVERSSDSYVVASGWGPAAAWYRNILHDPDVTIEVGTRTLPVTAVPLDAEEGAEVFSRYGSTHRTTAKHVLPRVLGVAVDGSDADFRAVGRHLPFVRFVPRAEV